jgi:hypothetical protein
VADEPERFDVFLSELVVHERDDVLQVLVIGGRPDARRRIRRGNDQPVLVLVVDDREIVPLPVAVRAATVQAQHERHLFAALFAGWLGGGTGFCPGQSMRRRRHRRFFATKSQP